jgi:peptidoglycan/LPS O-acetylase OafA/YrhL
METRRPSLDRVLATPHRAVRRSLHGHVERGFRPDIEGLRAIAVIAVIAFHLGVPGVSGGFIGVDVFFVVSGFLITRLILGELAASGSISLRTFWGRRARRLLPASTLTVIVTVMFAQRMLPPLSMRSLAVDAVAAGTFTTNFVFADRLGDYFGAQFGSTNPSPLLHYWSLAVEEQFYLCWPPLLVLLTRRPQQYRRLVLATIVVLATVSLGVSVWLTSSRPSWAFFLLPARMGELLAGAALAVVGSGIAAIPARWRATLGWLGIAVVAGACLGFDETIPWPGLAVLLPVVATMAVIVSVPSSVIPWAPAAVLAVPPLQWVGRHSYALYLWHWPALVLAEAEWGPLSWPQRFAAIGVAVGASALSVRLVENPVRHSRYFSAVSWRSLSLGLAMCVLMVGVGLDLRSSTVRLDGGVEAAAPELAGPSTVLPVGIAAPPLSTLTVPPTTTADVTTSASVATLAVPDPPTGQLAQLVSSTQQALRQATASAPVPSNLRPSLDSARDRSAPYNDGCVNIGANSQLQPCEYGTTGGGRTVLLYGDSHAVQWFEPLEQIALQRGWRLVVLAKGGCPVAEVDVPTPVLHFTCPPYRDRAIAWIERNEPDLVVVGNSYTQYPADADEWVEGTDATVERLAEVSPNIVLIGDNPASTQDPPACLSEHLDDASECATSRADAILPERISAEVAAARNHGVTFVDTTDWFCTDDVCPVVLGNLLVMRDETHITAPMAEFLRPLLEAAIVSSM